MAMAGIIRLLLLLLISFVALVTATTATAGTVFGVELIHRDSPKSPLYNSSLTPFDRLQAAALRSVNRANYLASRLAMKTSLHLDFALLRDAEFLMRADLGTPKAQGAWGIVDTGSDLNWVNCHPCQCFNWTKTIFRPANSVSYRKLGCYTDECLSLPGRTCSKDGTCQYHYAYGDGSNIDGILSTETFIFHTFNNRFETHIPNVVFGCNFRSLSTVGEDLGSLIGLGPQAPSLIHQLAPKYISKFFSYCLNPWAKEGKHSKLYLGRTNITFSGKPTVTPLMTQDGYYAVQLDLISAPGDFTISFDSRKSNLRAGNIIFDSGTVLTMLDDEVVEELVAGLKVAIDLETVDPVGKFQLCFAVRSSEQENKLPGLTFTFRGDSEELIAAPDGLFVWVSRYVKCMAIVGTKRKVQIFGHLMQHNLWVGHDLEKMELIIHPKDCTQLPFYGAGSLRGKNLL